MFCHYHLLKGKVADMERVPVGGHVDCCAYFLAVPIVQLSDVSSIKNYSYDWVACSHWVGSEIQKLGV